MGIAKVKFKSSVPYNGGTRISIHEKGDKVSDEVAKAYPDKVQKKK